MADVMARHVLAGWDEDLDALLSAFDDLDEDEWDEDDWDDEWDDEEEWDEDDWDEDWEDDDLV